MRKLLEATRSAQAVVDQLASGKHTSSLYPWQPKCLSFDRFYGYPCLCLRCCPHNTSYVLQYHQICFYVIMYIFLYFFQKVSPYTLCCIPSWFTCCDISYITYWSTYCMLLLKDGWSSDSELFPVEGLKADDIKQAADQLNSRWVEFCALLDERLAWLAYQTKVLAFYNQFQQLEQAVVTAENWLKVQQPPASELEPLRIQVDRCKVRGALSGSRYTVCVSVHIVVCHGFVTTCAWPSLYWYSTFSTEFYVCL